MEPIRTDRFVLRELRLSDAAALAAYRSDPETAHLQSWTAPYPLESAVTMISAQVELDGPTDGEWYALGINEPPSEELLGDVVCHLGWQGRSAEIGYTLAPAARGHGVATEAARGLIAHLFSHGVQRVHAAIHPENFASAMVLERLGFVHEGTHRQAYWVGDECTDDVVFGMLSPEFEAWSARPAHRPGRVGLVEVTAANRDEVRGLTTHWSQQRFVSPMARSFADIVAPDPDDAGEPAGVWHRAVTADDDVVGFVMMIEPSPTHPEPYLWRLLFDRHHQRRGIGTRVLDLVVDHCRQRGDQAVRVSYGQGPGNPGPFYLDYGFVPTGRIVGHEVEARLVL